jgi:hemoglobin
VTSAEIRTLVVEFYDRVREDPDLGPIFGDRMDGRWPEHLERMCEFWSTVLLGTRSYRGDPMGAHIRIPGITRSHFGAWMDLFTVTAEETMTPEGAANVVARAGRMRLALERVACDAPEHPEVPDSPARRDPRGRSSLPITSP